MSLGLSLSKSSTRGAGAACSGEGKSANRDIWGAGGGGPEGPMAAGGAGRARGRRPCGARRGSARGCVSTCGPPADAGHLVQLRRCCLMSPNSISAFSAARTAQQWRGGKSATRQPTVNLPTHRTQSCKAALGQRSSPGKLPRYGRGDANGYESHSVGWERPCVFHAPTRATW